MPTTIADRVQSVWIFAFGPDMMTPDLQLVVREREAQVDP